MRLSWNQKYQSSRIASQPVEATSKEAFRLQKARPTATFWAGKKWPASSSSKSMISKSNLKEPRTICVWRSVWWLKRKRTWIESWTKWRRSTSRKRRRSCRHRPYWCRTWSGGCRSRKIGIKKERKNIKETNKEHNKVKNNETTKIKNKNIFIF